VKREIARREGKGRGCPCRPNIIHLEKEEIFTRKWAEELERKEIERERETQHLKREKLDSPPRALLS